MPVGRECRRAVRYAGTVHRRLGLPCRRAGALYRRREVSHRTVRAGRGRRGATRRRREVSPRNGGAGRRRRSAYRRHRDAAAPRSGGSHRRRESVFPRRAAFHRRRDAVSRSAERLAAVGMRSSAARSVSPPSGCRAPPARRAGPRAAGGAPPDRRDTPQATDGASRARRGRPTARSSSPAGWTWLPRLPNALPRSPGGCPWPGGTSPPSGWRPPSVRDLLPGCRTTRRRNHGIDSPSGPARRDRDATRRHRQAIARGGECSAATGRHFPGPAERLARLRERRDYGGRDLPRRGCRSSCRGCRSPCRGCDSPLSGCDPPRHGCRSACRSRDFLVADATYRVADLGRHVADEPHRTLVRPPVRRRRMTITWTRPDAHPIRGCIRCTSGSASPASGRHVYRPLFFDHRHCRPTMRACARVSPAREPSTFLAQGMAH